METPEKDLRIEQRYPKLESGGYKVKSPRDPRYNCVAFAVGDTGHYWQFMGYPGRSRGSYFWPDHIKGDALEDWIELFNFVGFSLCETGDLEPDVVKIAIYVVEDNIPTHVARQTRSGKWKSKLGRGKDIVHDTLESLAGDVEDEYGTVARFMKKRRYESEDTDE